MVIIIADGLDCSVKINIRPVYFSVTGEMTMLMNNDPTNFKDIYGTVLLLDKKHSFHYNFLDCLCK